MESLKYLPFETIVDAAFWHMLSKKKLEEYCLSEGPFKATTTYSTNSASGINPRVLVDISALQSTGFKRSPQLSTFVMHGKIRVFNNLESFKSVDKQQFIDLSGQEMFEEALLDSNFLKDPDSLIRFELLTFCDLKHHKFYFWFAYPAVFSNTQPTVISCRRIDEEFSEHQINSFLTSYYIWRSEHSSSFFHAKIKIEDHTDVPVIVSSCIDFDEKLPGSFLCFCDSSTHPQFPAWPLRNILYALSSIISETTTVRVICFRERIKDGRHHCNHSLVLTIELIPIGPSTLKQFVGWEKYHNQLKPRVVDLSSSMDPVKLAESAVNLNLKLMKWRLMPELKLDDIHNTRCLLIGAGTLGCHVARQLLAWGVQTITFVDKSNVSTSNPVRQSLFVFEDSKNGGKPKSEAAAHFLTNIFPGVRSRGYQLGIPMPGHPVTCLFKEMAEDSYVLPHDLGLDVEQLKLPPYLSEVYKTCSVLDELVKHHDVVFLLTDTRESRWLPTLLSCMHGKLVINAALGFDTYLVMRHGCAKAGISPSSSLNAQDIDPTLAVDSVRKVDGNKLGCYFCNDVVGPKNSTQNLALDQQCTVTRPGVSMIASSLAVELLVSIIQHPAGAAASAPSRPEHLTFHQSDCSAALGIIPHQIRGFLSQFQNVLPTTAAFSRCPACSQPVLDAYIDSGFRFLVNVFDDAAHLEQVCGLHQLREITTDDQVISLSESDGDE